MGSNHAKASEPGVKQLRRRKPFRLLAHLSETELDQFRHFLLTPHAQPKRDKVLAFFDQCRQAKVWASSLDKPAFEAMAGTKWADNAFDKLVSQLYDLLLAFAGQQALARDADQHTNFALQFFQPKGIDAREIEQKVKEGMRGIDDQVQDEQYFRKRFDLENQSAERANSRSTAPEERGLDKLHQLFDSYYYIVKLRLICGSVNERTLYAHDAQAVLPESLLLLLTESYPRMPALAQVYFHALQVLLGNEDPSHLEYFKARLNSLPVEARGGKEMEELSAYLLNHYTRQLNNGLGDALPKVYHFYTDSLYKGWILDGGRLLPEHFKNLIVTCCRMDKVAEAREIFHRYKDQLTDTCEGAAIHYNEAILEVYEKNFGFAIPRLEELLKAKASIRADQYYGLDLRCTLLKTYFERLGQEDLEAWDDTEEKLAALLHAFPAYITRRNLQHVRQLRYENFRKAIQRLHTLAYGLPLAERADALRGFRREVSSSSNLIDKGWFLQQVEALL